MCNKSFQECDMTGEENDWIERPNHQLGSFKKRENEVNEDQFFGLRKT